MSDCPLAPNKEYRQGQPDGCIVTGTYMAPCKDWDGVNCNWFEPPMAIRELVKFIDTSMPDISKRRSIRRGKNG